MQLEIFGRRCRAPRLLSEQVGWGGWGVEELDLSCIKGVTENMGFESCVENPFIGCMTFSEIQGQSHSTSLRAI